MSKKVIEEIMIWVCRIVFILSLSFFIINLLNMIADEENYNVGCATYIEAAATADRVSSAKENLSIALSYAEEHNLTSGGDDNSIGVWYGNLKKVYLELEHLPEELTEVERLYVLRWIRSSINEIGIMPYGWDPKYNFHPKYLICCAIAIVFMFISGVNSVRYPEYVVYL